MKRFASNFAILLVLTVAITAVLARLADAPHSREEQRDVVAVALGYEPTDILPAVAGRGIEPFEQRVDVAVRMGGRDTEKVRETGRYCRVALSVLRQACV